MNDRGLAQRLARKLPPRLDAERRLEGVQEAILVLLVRLAAGGQVADREAFIVGVARRLACKQLNRRRSPSLDEAFGPGAGPPDRRDPEPEQDRIARRLWVACALDQLTSEERQRLRSAYFFRIGGDSVQYCSCPAPAGSCGNPDDHGGCLNSAGHGAVLSAAGSGSVALDDLRLHCQWMPANQPALLFMGGTSAMNPLGDGQLCVNPGPTGIRRFPVAFASAQGAVQHGPGLVAFSQSFPSPGPIQPGEDRHFQVWFRDPFGPCATHTNLSNAVRVTFKP